MRPSLVSTLACAGALLPIQCPACRRYSSLEKRGKSTIHGTITASSTIGKSRREPGSRARHSAATSATVNTAGIVMSSANSIAKRQSMKKEIRTNASSRTTCQPENHRTKRVAKSDSSRRGAKAKAARIASGIVIARRSASTSAATAKPT